MLMNIAELLTNRTRRDPNLEALVDTIPRDASSKALKFELRKQSPCPARE